MQVDYFPYGEERVTAGNETAYKFSGKERDSGIGLDYFGSRYYAYNIGRWLVPDPAGQGWSPYVYCGNSPFVYVDPDGELALLATIGIGIVVAASVDIAIQYYKFHEQTGSWDITEFFSTSFNWKRTAVAATFGGISGGVLSGFGTLASQGIINASQNIWMPAVSMGLLNAAEGYTHKVVGNIDEYKWPDAAQDFVVGSIMQAGFSSANLWVKNRVSSLKSKHLQKLINYNRSRTMLKRARKGLYSSKTTKSAITQYNNNHYYGKEGFFRSKHSYDSMRYYNEYLNGYLFEIQINYIREGVFDINSTY